MSVVLLENPRRGVAVIRLNRPEVRNALTTEVRRLIEKHVNEIAEDDAVKVIVLTGNDAVFAVGADLREQSGRDVVGAINTFTTHALWRSPKPVIVFAAPFATPLQLGAGVHYVRLEHPSAPAERREIDLRPGARIVLQVSMKLSPLSPDAGALLPELLRPDAGAPSR